MLRYHERHIDYESPTYDGWPISDKPVIPEPCRCSRPYWFRDEIGVRCLYCARRRRLRCEVQV